MFRREIRWAIWALILLSAGGLLKHLRIHPPGETLFNWIPPVVGLFAIFVLPFLFNRRLTVPAAYVINIAIVVIGTVTMAFYSATNFQAPVTFTRIFTHTTFPDILVLLVRIPLGEIIIAYWRRTAPEPEDVPASKIVPIPAPEQPDVPVATVADSTITTRNALKAIFVTLFAGLMGLAAVMDLQHYDETIEIFGALHGNTIIAGRLSAMFATVLIMAQFALGARLAPLDAAFGFEKVLKFHRYTGATAVCLAILHPILLYITPHYVLGPAGPETWSELIGAIALVALLIVAITSIWRVFLNLRYETWHLIHYLGFAAVVLVAWHSLMIGTDLQNGWAMWAWVSLLVGYLLLFLWTRVIRRGIILRRRWRVERVVPVSHDTWQLDLVPVGHEGMRHLPGQFGLLTLHRDDVRDERHPFTFSSPPRVDGSVSFTIKESGDYTRTIGHAQEGITATVEGPSGQFSHLRHDGERFLMIAGGVGITPILSMLRYMAAHGDERPVTLIWGNRTEGDILYREEFESLQKRLDLRIVHVLSRQPGYEGETGYLTMKLLRRLLSDEELSGDVYLCGPEPMMNLVDEALIELGVHGRRIHTEKFVF